VTDAKTGTPISQASITLYRVPGALPDKNGQTNQCRTVDTRPASSGGVYGNWSGLPAADLSSGQFVDPQTDAALFEPHINSQLTTAEGRYAWNVAEGCWFVYV
jgi:hypothetical protein